MTDKWGADGVRVVRGVQLEAARRDPGGTGRVTAGHFTGSGGDKTWMGGVRLGPAQCTGPHHHGRHEFALLVMRGHTELRWGVCLEYVAEAGPGYFAFFRPFVLIRSEISARPSRWTHSWCAATLSP